MWTKLHEAKKRASNIGIQWDYAMYEPIWSTTASFARYQVRSFDSFSAQAASVDSFLQNVKRTWRAPMAGSS
jgi:hypothetical protein